MQTKGTMVTCDEPYCKASIFLEETESLEDAGWLHIPTEGDFCEEHKQAAAERARNSGAFI